ncbi:MAG: PrsW family intramembrane metalloprotease [Candidatus Microbacterium phytovorans]|uniref:PrsW family intramembrane metalloprotease n=1 Tax=Candidatus Microbacterium phytovorans TaxID=3121374 RepID=A0AAJ5W1F7_9MICO|nr:PrsW family intramembrane metalloprotease [Microbacterium sp.]WEK13992.1 MAG: PrsW family intramembrane metalloprotease [Microbacterium sp.]
MAHPSPFAQPPHGAPAAVASTASAPALPVPVRRGRTAPVWLFALLVVLALGLVAYVVSFLGVAAPAIGGVLALIPLAGVLLAVRIVDRWEPEPRGLVIAAVAWGAVAAVALSLLVDLALSPAMIVVDPNVGDAFSSVVQAPVVEEVAKGIGVLLIFIFGRRAFDGPVDGVVYGALVGAGFAFTENILYFATSLIEGGVTEVTFTFVLRGILSPFAHVMFTAVTGYALGRAARDGATTSAALGPWALGLIGAIVLHAIWNGSAVFADFFALYVTLQIPLFLAFVAGVLLLRREEARLTRARLGEYAAAGWFSAGEVEMLATGRGRRHALAWARTLPGDRRALMADFIAEATALAAARQRALTGRDAAAADDERVYLARTIAARSRLLTP